MPPNPNVVVGVCAIVKSDCDYLMLQRKGTGLGDPREEYGTWDFPGGWIEHGETAQATAVRECKEETGLIVVPIKEDGFSVITILNKTIVILYVLCAYIGGNPINKEPDKALTVKWIPQRTLCELDLFAPTYTWWHRPKWGSGDDV